MLCRPERLGPAGLAALAAAGIAVSGCGRADLHGTAAVPAKRHGGQSAETGGALGARPGRRSQRSRGAGGDEVAVPLPLTAARAAGFAHTVTLSGADLPGARPSPRSAKNPAEEREAAKCGARETKAIGGGRSPDFERGRGLDRESISSGVDVLSDAAAVRDDLAYAASHAGLQCYEKVLGKSLTSEGDSHIRLLGLHIAPLALTVAPARRAMGIRITARVGIPGSAISVGLFVDALSLPYGPAELDLYTTSFVQPVAERTQSELLALLRSRAQLHPL